jgi:hypothetical protein
VFTIDVTAPTTAPTFQNVPSDITVAPQNASGSVVTFTPPTATDVFGDPLSVGCSPASGTTFAIGTTTVTCGATDQWSNHAAASFSVTVTSVTESLAFTGYSTSDGPSGSTVPATITVSEEDGGPGVGDFASVLLYATDTGSLAGDLTPSGTIGFGVSPSDWFTVVDSMPASCSAIENTPSGVMCLVYFNAPGNYTVSLSFTSSDPAYGDVENGPNVIVDVG